MTSWAIFTQPEQMAAPFEAATVTSQSNEDLPQKSQKYAVMALRMSPPSPLVIAHQRMDVADDVAGTEHNQRNQDDGQIRHWRAPWG